MGRPFHFVDVPRTGSTSTRAALGDETEKHVHAAERRRRADDWEEAFTFVVVRHPCARVVSQFKHRWTTHQRECSPEGIERWVVETYGRGGSFVGVKRSNGYRHRLSWPQWKWITDESDTEVIVDRVYRFSDFDEAWDDVTCRLDVDAELRHLGGLGGKVAERFPTFDGERVRWRPLITSTTLDVVRRHFADDFTQLFPNDGRRRLPEK